MNFEGLTHEQQEKAKACGTPEDLLTLAKEEGIELTDEQVEGISGGKWDFFDECETHSRCKCKRVVRN